MIDPDPGEEPLVEAVLDVQEHRHDVVRRLLELGVSAHVLQAILPGFGGVIEEAASDPERCPAAAVAAYPRPAARLPHTGSPR